MEKKFFLCFIFALLTLNCKAQDVRWRYDFNEHRDSAEILPPKDWGNEYPDCDGSKQSPINVKFSGTKYNENLKPITIIPKLNNKIYKHQSREIWNVSRNVRSPYNFYIYPLSHSYSFTLFPEKEEYELTQMHFHWRGSEHFINSKKYSAELHMVHQKKSNNSQKSVIGFLFKTVTKDNKKLTPILNIVENNIRTIRIKPPTWEIKTNLVDIIGSLHINDYYRYHGSFTRPPCSEVVEWNVVDKLINISEKQLLRFQTLKDVYRFNILTNERPVQKLNGREVLRSFKEAQVISPSYH